MERLLDMYHSVGHVSPCIVCNSQICPPVTHFAQLTFPVGKVWTLVRHLICVDTIRRGPKYGTLGIKGQNKIWATTWQNQQNEWVPSEDWDKPGYPPSLIRVFAVCMKKAWVLSYPSSAQWRLWSDWEDAQADLSSLGAQSLCWFCHALAHMFLANCLWKCVLTPKRAWFCICLYSGQVLKRGIISLSFFQFINVSTTTFIISKFINPPATVYFNKRHQSF